MLLGGTTHLTHVSVILGNRGHFFDNRWLPHSLCLVSWLLLSSAKAIRCGASLSLDYLEWRISKWVPTTTNTQRTRARTARMQRGGTVGKIKVFLSFSSFAPTFFSFRSCFPFYDDGTTPYTILCNWPFPS